MVAVEVAKAAAVAVPAEGPIRPEAEAKAETVAEAEEEREYKSDMRKLEELMSKLNPCAQEFVPSSRRPGAPGAGLSADAPVFVSAADLFGGQLQAGGGRDSSSDGSSNGGGLPQNRRRRSGSFNQGRRRIGVRTRRSDREDSVRRTVYVSDIDQQVTEQKLAEVFSNCGQVVDCRICGDPHSVLRFAFIEFADDAGARAALTLGGTMLGYYPVRVLPSKTAILPVNPKFLPRTEDEKEMVSRTVYCTNIDKKVTEDDVNVFFQRLCGKVSRLRLLGDYVHSTCIAFVEFTQAESAILALNYSGMVLGSLPVRVSPSKTPVRPRPVTPRDVELSPVSFVPRSLLRLSSIAGIPGRASGWPWPHQNSRLADQ